MTCLHHMCLPAPHRPCLYANAWGGTLKMWSLYDVVSGREQIPAHCVHGSYERAVSDNRHRRAGSGWRHPGASWCLRQCGHESPRVVCSCSVQHILSSSKKKKRKNSLRIVSLFLQSRSSVQIPISPGCQSFCCRQWYHYCPVLPRGSVFGLKDQATVCNSRILIAGTSTTGTI